jgi:hypothetical protein
MYPSWAIKYRDDKDLAAHADVVVQGEITEELGTKYKTKGDYLSYNLISSVKVTSVIKGDKSLKDQQITVKQLGGEDETTQIISDDVTPLKKGNKLTLFLKKVEGGYSLINEDDGIYTLDDKNEYKNIKTSTKLNKDLVSN